MNVLLISLVFYPDAGGSITVYREVYKQFAGKGCRVSVITRQTAEAPLYEAVDGIEIYRVPVKGFLSVKLSKAFEYLKLIINVLKLAKRKNIDAIHCGRVIPEGLAGCIASALLRKPCFIYAYGEELLRYSLQFPEKYIMKFLFRRCRGVFAISEYTKRIVRGLSVPPDRICVYKPAVTEIRVMEDDIFRIKKRYNLEHKTVLISVCRLIKRKGIDDAIRAYMRLKKKYPNLAYIIIGRGKEEKSLKELSAELNTAKDVVFIGYMPWNEVMPYLKCADIFVMPNKVVPSDPEGIEGFGIVFLEAGLYGLPVIAGGNGGAREAVADGKTGFLVEGGNVSDIEEKLEQLVKDSSLRKRMGEYAGNWVKTNFAWDKTADTVFRYMNERIN